MKRDALPPWRRWLHALGCVAAAGLCVGTVAGCASSVPGHAAAARGASAAVSGAQFVVVAVADAPEARAGAGTAARAGYPRAAGYAASDRARALAEGVAATHGLTELQAWTIAPLRLRCMLYRLPEGRAQDTALAALAADDRVQLAQPLNEFETLASPPPVGAYNDPYLALQTGFARIDAAGAQTLTRGEGVTVAVIDTGVDGQHPELQGRLAAVRDLVDGSGASASPPERHGTEVAGIIAAAANNGIGIVGVAPEVRLLVLRACWAVQAAVPSAAARCNTFTLARALVAAMEGGADVVNLSLGGPRDALLEGLATLAMARGIVLVGALPAGGRRDGFPSALPGVLTVAANEDRVPAPGLLTAPGQRILTLAPGGGYEFASGSSMAAAHVSGAVALMRAINRRLDAAQLLRLLGDSQPIDICRALRSMAARADARCKSPS